MRSHAFRGMGIARRDEKFSPPPAEGGQRKTGNQLRASACVEVGGRRVGRSVSDGSSRIEIRLSRMRSHHEGLHQKWHHATYDLETRTEGLGVGTANPGTLSCLPYGSEGVGIGTKAHMSGGNRHHLPFSLSSEIKRITHHSATERAK